MSTEHQPPRANPWMISTFVLLGLIAGFGVAQVPYFKALGQQAAVVKQDAAVQPAADVATPPKRPDPPTLTAEQMEKLIDDDAVLGEKSAPITIVEFSDFQCPYCARFFRDTLGLIEKDYIKTGKVKFVYRDLPLPSHPQALPAAEAAECADEQGKFKGMHDLLFLNQPEWSGNPEADKVFAGYAKQLGLNEKTYGECLKDQEHLQEIQKDYLDAANLNIDGTPGFYINGKFLSGAMPYATIFKPIFEAELAGKKWEFTLDQWGNPAGVKVL